MRYLYSFLFYLALPFVLIRLLWRSRKNPEMREHFKERLGFTPHFLHQCLWIHAVSMGESIAAIPLIKSLKNKYPSIPIIVTNMTLTGRNRINAAFGDSVVQSYIPYDLPYAIDRFLKYIQPVACIIMETELWPNLFNGCKKRNIPIIVTNARLSEKSAKGYKSISPLTREMFEAITALSSQGKADAERFIELGLPAEKVQVTGNLKFDVELPADLGAKTEILRQQLGQDRLIWIAASTHPGEEEIVLAAHRKVLEAHPGALLILVPRHPERFDEVAQMILQQNFSIARRSKNDAVNAETQVYLADTMGELLLMYSVADIAFIAGSFAKIGGHNMLEAAVQSKPIVTGPELYNFAEISDMLLEQKGMIKVESKEELAAIISQLLSDKAMRAEVGNNALQVVDRNRGALQKQLDAISLIVNQHYNLNR